MPEHVSRESETFGHTETDSLVALLDRVENLPEAAALRARSYDLLELRPGALAADVGCGAGRAVAEMAERGAKAVGVDLSEDMIDVSRRRWPRLEFRVASANELPFADGEIGGYRADKVLHDLDDPATALGEAHRVLKPGGRIVLLGQDWDTLVIDSDTPAVTRAVVHARADSVPSPRAARQYGNLLRDAGFTEINIEAYTGVFTDDTMLPALSGITDAACAAGAISRDQADHWVAEQTERARDGRMFVAIPLFVASAQRRPGIAVTG
ncbi:methyltransferase domain-containing protein [Amycolatopsis sp. NPDC051071]|uniref:methyltransferase domain-containing protein n=1 Tax=Amycolatopsis sp. NPDC051071 TaxID=3154637 RepID=UPI003438131F